MNCKTGDVMTPPNEADTHKPMTGRRKPPFADRIRAALNGGKMTLCALELKLFPEDEYPNAHRCAVQGGPPGVRWMLLANLRRLGVPFTTHIMPNASNIVGPWKNGKDT